jgi:hypothetical protein
LNLSPPKNFSASFIKKSIGASFIRTCHQMHDDEKGTAVTNSCHEQSTEMGYKPKIKKKKGTAVTNSRRDGLQTNDTSARGHISAREIEREMSEQFEVHCLCMIACFQQQAVCLLLRK